MQRVAVDPSSWSVRLGFDTLPQHFPRVNGRFEGTGVRFATTLLGVASLAARDLVVALEATAMA